MKCRKGWMAVCVLAMAFLFLFGNSLQADAATKKKKSLSKAKITLSKSSYTYNGKAKKPKVTVKLGKKKLKSNKDYTIKYSNNKKAGKAKVTIKAKKGKKAKYTGSKSKTFKIKKASRKIVPGKTAYSAVEGDGAFSITAKASKGGGTITYSCATTNVIKVTKAGKVTIVKTFDKTCKTLSSQTKDTIKKATAKVKISVPATSNYNAASTTVTVTINKKTVRAFSTYDSVTKYEYPSTSPISSTPNYKKLTDFPWTIVDKYQMPGLAPTADDDWTKDYIQCNNLCPQGVCMAGDYMLTTAYCMDDIHNSCIFVYSNKTGEFLKTLVLKDQKTHVGGITYDEKNKNIWVCHAKKDKTTGLYSLERITYTDLVKYATGKKEYTTSKSVELHKIPTKPSTIAYNKKDGYLWVAQFSVGAVPGDDPEEEDTDEEVEDNDTSAPRMYAYEYDAKENKLKQVRIINNPAEEDYLGVKTEEVTTEGGEETEPVTVVQIASVYSSSSLKLSVKGETEATEKLKKGDILYKVNDEKITSRSQLEELLGKCNADDTLSIEVHRTVAPDEEGGEPTELILEGNLILGERGNVLYRGIPYYVQGITFSEGKTIFSCSYGRNRTKKRFVSELQVYDTASTTDPFMLGDLELAVALPPMVEEVEMVGDEVYMIFESAATTYLEGTDGKGPSTCPIDKIISVKLGLK